MSPISMTPNSNCSVVTFYDLGNIWLEIRKGRIKESTYEKYAYLLKKYIYPFLGKERLNSIYSAEIDYKLSYIYHDSYESDISYSTMKSILFLIKAILNYGYNSNYINERIPICFAASSKEINEIHTLNEKEELIIMNYVLKNYSNNSLGILIALYTGTRLGEICALQRKDIDFTAGILHITKTVQRLKNHSENITAKSILKITKPKSKESCREIPIPHTLLEYMKNCGIQNLEDYLYILGQKNVPYEPRTLQYGFSSILKKCEIPHYNFHMLRHTFATKCIRLGFDIKTLSEILGHSNVYFTMNQYVHSDIEYKRRQMKLLDDNMYSISQN